jgi:hypothetical protein
MMIVNLMKRGKRKKVEKFDNPKVVSCKNYLNAKNMFPLIRQKPFLKKTKKGGMGP